jgi:HAD superfamily hydrolase (TIGR01509 family)
MTIKGLLLDSGGVLIQPRGGRWNPRFDFEEKMAQHAPHISAAEVAAAVATGQSWLAAHTATPDYDDFHRVILDALALDATPELLADLVSPLAFSAVVEAFADVVPTLAELHARGLRMAVVSDAWAGLEGVHAELGFGHYFDAYAISQVVGACKPDPRMYRTASDGLGLPPEECFFVDDDPELVAAAIDLGYSGAALLRDGASAEVPVIRSLTGVLDFL